MKTASGELSPFAETKSPRKGWSPNRWLGLITLVLGVHVALIFTFGTRISVTPRAVTNVPNLELAAGSGEWLMLNDPTLFALPRREGFAGPAWVEPPPVHGHMVDWTEKPRLLELSNELAGLGAVFGQFMQTNRFARFQFPMKPPAPLTMPLVPLEPPLVEASTLHVEGVLAKRLLLASMKLPSWPSDHLVAPSRVQVLVNAAGHVVSAVLLPPKNSGENRDADADQLALDLARATRFAPASGFAVGQLIFDWHTVAPIATNAPPIL